MESCKGDNEDISCCMAVLVLCRSEDWRSSLFVGDLVALQENIKNVSQH